MFTNVWLDLPDCIEFSLSCYPHMKKDCTNTASFIILNCKAFIINNCGLCCALIYSPNLYKCTWINANGYNGYGSVTGTKA